MTATDKAVVTHAVSSQSSTVVPSSLASLSETAMDDYTVTYYGNVVHTLHVNDVVAHMLKGIE